MWSVRRVIDWTETKWTGWQRRRSTLDVPRLTVERARELIGVLPAERQRLLTGALIRAVAQARPYREGCQS